MRRGTDPWESHETGLINTVKPEAKVPSHQGSDAKTVRSARHRHDGRRAAFNLSHLHFAMVETTRPVDLDELKLVLWQEPRIAFAPTMGSSP